MKRIGMAKASGHSYFFGALLNEFDVGRFKELGGGAVAIVTQDEEPKIPLGGAETTHV